MNDVTPKQAEVLAVINRRLAAGEPSPAIREICEELGGRSTCTVHQHVQALIKKGRLRSAGAGSHRALVPVEPTGPQAEIARLRGLIERMLRACYSPDLSAVGTCVEVTELAVEALGTAAADRIEKEIDPDA